MQNTLQTKTLLIICGHPGCGKSTIAEQLLTHLCLSYISNDTLANPVFPNTRMSEEYFEYRPLLYKLFYAVTLNNLRVGNSVLWDAPFVRESSDDAWYRQVNEICESTKASLKIAACRCSEDTLKSRIIARNCARDQWKRDNWEEFLRREPLDFEIVLPHITLNTELPVENSVRKLLEYVTQPG